MTKSVFLLVLCTLLNIGCGKKLEDSDTKQNGGSTGASSGITSRNSTAAQQNLLSALESNDTLLVRSALTNLDDLNFIFSSNGESPLTLAIKSTKSEIVLAIIEKSNIGDVENKYLEIPLNLIIESRRIERTEKRDLMKKLFLQGVDINKKGINGVTPIQVAIRSREEALAMVLTKKGANLSERYNNENLKELAKARKMDRLVTLFDEIQLNPVSNNETIKVAIKSAKRNLLEYLMNTGNETAKIVNENDLLIDVLKIQKLDDRVSVLNYLLTVKGVKPDGRGIHTTPLIYAASQFQSTHRNSLSYLIRAGANIYHKDNFGRTALDYAAKYLNQDNVTFLYRRIVTVARDSFNTPNSQASNLILSGCYMTPSKKVAESILWNGKIIRYNILRTMKCPFY